MPFPDTAKSVLDADVEHFSCSCKQFPNLLTKAPEGRKSLAHGVRRGYAGSAAQEAPEGRKIFDYIIKRNALAQQMEYLRKGAVEIIREEDLQQKLAASRQSQRPLRIKAGFDPIVPVLHWAEYVPSCNRFFDQTVFFEL